MLSGFLTEDFPHKPPRILQRRIHSPADLPQRNALRGPLVQNPAERIVEHGNTEST